MQDQQQDLEYPTGMTFGAGAYERGGVEASVTLGPQVADLSPHDLGALGEDLAAAYLQKEGYEILERNWTCARGEADIVACDRGAIVLVEVKTRLLPDAHTQIWPELAVNVHKRKRYAQIASCYMLYAGINSVRFDVVAVSVVPGGTAHIHHIESAFGRDA